MSPAPNANAARRVAEQARAACYGDAPDVAMQRHQEALQLLEGDEPSALRADVLRWQGTVLRDRGRTSDAEPLYRQSLEIASQLGYESGVAHALNCLAGLAQRRGDIAQAVNLLTEAHVLAARCGAGCLSIMIRTNLGIIADIGGDSDAAIAHLRVALYIAEAVGEEQQVIRVLINLGAVSAKRERYDEAEQLATRGLALARVRGDLYYEGVFEENRAELRLMCGNFDDAFSSIHRALDIANQRRDDVRKAAGLKLLGAFYRMMGRPAEAVETLQYALTLAAVGEDALLGGETLYQFGLALHDRGDCELARVVWRTALDAFERITASDWCELVRTRLALGSTQRYL